MHTNMEGFHRASHLKVNINDAPLIQVYMATKTSSSVDCQFTMERQMQQKYQLY